MSRPKYKCKSGWLLTRSSTDNKTLVPFFLKVRGSDIIWNKEIFPDDIDNYINSEEKEVVTNHAHIEFYNPDNGWNIKLYPDYRYDASIRLNVRKNFNINNGDTSDLVGHIKLPYLTLNDERLTPGAIISTQDEDLAYANIIISLPDYSDNEDNTLEYLELHLRNEFRNFDERFRARATYEKSILLLSVHGQIDVNRYNN